MKKIYEFLISIKFLIISLVIIIIALIWETIFSKNQTPAKSILVIAGFLMLFINLSFCIFDKIYRKIKYKIYFYLIHFGLLITISGFILSATFSFSGEVELVKDILENKAIDGEYVYELPFYIKLKKFSIEYYKTPKPIIEFKDNIIELKENAEFEINNKKFRLLKIFNDFAIEKEGVYINKSEFWNNPAILLEKKERNKKENLFMFSNFKSKEYDGMLFKVNNLDIKNYISEIKIYYQGKSIDGIVSVNNPFKFLDYKIYQTSYDPTNPDFTLLTVKKDNWIWLIYSGFILIAIGVFLWII